MCGIAGIFSRNSTDFLKSEIKRMIDTMPHRGPDDQGIWIENNVAFGHVRLAIQDLSPSGKQPMLSNTGRYTISFNGEIYNFLHLKNDLIKTGCQFRGGSDTEVILAAIEQWGLDAALESFEGMFAFSLWDKANNTLTLCRDRLGEKPLFYGWSGKDFVWASELKAITRLTNWKGEIREESVSTYLKYGYVPSPFSIYKKIYKLTPGSFLTVNFEQIQLPDQLNPYAEEQSTNLQPKYYWNFASFINQEVNSDLSYREAVETLDNLLNQTTRNQMICDVPYGAFLSGGIDSSAVVAAMQSQSTSPINTFTIGFEEKDYNEAPFAAVVARHLGTHHHEMTISSNDCLELVPKIPCLMDEPFADSSVLPAYFVSKLAKQNVTVCLSGDGGDELFCGYNRYVVPARIERKLRLLPDSIRKLVSKIILLIPTKLVDRAYALIEVFIASKNTRVGLKAQKLAYLLTLNQPSQIYDMLISYCRDTDNITFSESASSFTLETQVLKDIQYLNFDTSRFMAMDTLTYLPDDNLAKVDRTSMAFSLETRLPLLNHKIVELSWSLPFEMKYNGRVSKRILRDVLYKRVPKELIERPKMGFSVPIADWLRGPLKEWGYDYLSDMASHRTRDFFNIDKIENLWSDHMSRRRDNSAPLWNILMYFSWLKTS